MSHSSGHSEPEAAVRPQAASVVVLAALLVVSLLWSYWRTIEVLFEDWQADPNYSVGQLVPLAALYMLWTDRHRLRKCRVEPCWWGLGVLLFAQAARVIGLQLLIQSAVRYSLVISIFGVVLFVAGWQIFRRVFWILVFLFLMVPLSSPVHNAVSGPLQAFATASAVFVLELIGVVVTREGNVMLLNDATPVAVAEACSGLRMLTAFVVTGAVLAYVINRPRWQKVTLIVSTVPVAIACNLIRLVLTSLLFMYADSDTAERFFHDFAGLTMMPMAIGLLLIELWVLSKLTTPDKPA